MIGGRSDLSAPYKPESAQITAQVIGIINGIDSLALTVREKTVAKCQRCRNLQ